MHAVLLRSMLSMRLLLKRTPRFSDIKRVTDFYKGCSRVGTMSTIGEVFVFLETRTVANMADHQNAGVAAESMDLEIPDDVGGRVLSIQSHVVQGYVGNKSAVFPLQLLGMDVDIINSVHFSNHTGYKHFSGKHLRLTGDDLHDLLDGMEHNSLLKDAHTHLLTGYVGSITLLEAIVRVHQRLRAAQTNPERFMYVCDPVLGDLGKLYVPMELGTATVLGSFGANTIAYPVAVCMVPVDESGCVSLPSRANRRRVDAKPI